MQSQQQSLIYLHIAVLLFGGTALFAKLIGLNALDITAYRAAIAGLAICVLLSLQKKPIKLHRAKDYVIAILLGVAVGIHWVTYFAGMQLAGITVGMLAFFTYPVITVFLEPLFNKSKPKAKDIISAIVVIIGIYLLIPNVNLGDDITLGVVTGVVSALFFA
ncbi:DMT family transporter, partial [Pseudoalteromonas marina]|uniref:DMT family transporter n=1 Tax=Pseudoalteromonas marina TaxID=267375 RepID=UPI003C66309F